MITSQPIQALQLTGYDMYTRASYLTKFGKPAPPADPSRRAKAWIGYGTFWFLESTGPIVFKQETVPVSENLPNIEGAGPFAAYVIAPSGAWQMQGGVRTSVYNPLYLSLQSDAQALMTQLGGSKLIDNGANQFLPLSYDPTEQRREWEFTDQQGIVVNVGALLFIRNMMGAGAPGHWDQSGTTPTWVADSPKPDFTQPVWSAPCRALAANESIQPTGVFGFPSLMVDDGKTDPTSTPAAGGSFTDQDRQDLAMILSIVEQLAQKSA